MSKRPARCAADADVGLAAADFRRGDLRVGLVVGGGEFLGQRQHRGRAADDQAPGAAAAAGTARARARTSETTRVRCARTLVAPFGRDDWLGRRGERAGGKQRSGSIRCGVRSDERHPVAKPARRSRRSVFRFCERGSMRRRRGMFDSCERDVRTL